MRCIIGWRSWKNGSSSPNGCWPRPAPRGRCPGGRNADVAGHSHPGPRAAGAPRSGHRADDRWGRPAGAVLHRDHPHRDRGGDRSGALPPLQGVRPAAGGEGRWGGHLDARGPRHRPRTPARRGRGADRLQRADARPAGAGRAPAREGRLGGVMIAVEDLQGWVDRLGGGGLEVEHPAESVWVVHSQDGAGVVVSLLPPVAVLRIRVMESPKDGKRRAELFQRLLELNAADLLHGAYGVEGGHVVLTDTLALDGLDYVAFEASYDAMTLALATHSGALAPYREK